MKLKTMFIVQLVYHKDTQLFFHRTIPFLLLWMLFSDPVTAQVNNTGAMYISGNAGINNSFTNAFTANYQNDGVLYLTGDFTNNQPAMTEGSGTTQFTGVSLQKIKGSQTSVFHHVYISNAGGVQMNINTTMGGTISTVAGSLYFNGHALTMGGKINTAYTNASAFNVTASSDLNITGNAAAGNGLYFDASANTLHNLTITSGATGLLGNALNITAGSSFGTVVADGNFNAAGFLTLKSDAGGTSRVGQSAGNVTGNVTVERYVPPRRAWRFMAVPVNNDTLHIRTAWQEGVNNPSLSIRYDPHPGFGTHITGDNNTANGFDYNTTTNPSIKTWAPGSSGFSTTAPPTVSTLINAYDAYCLFVRGSRAVDLAQADQAIPDETVLRITGKLNNGLWSKTYSSIVANNILFVSNPFASSIDIAPMLASSTGIFNNKFYVWDPALAGTYGVGGYVTYSNGIMSPLTPNYPAATTIMQGGQAFMLQANATAASVSIKQNDKTASETDIFGRKLPPSFPVIYTSLMVPAENTLTLADGVAAGFGKRFSADVDGDDATKLWNFVENMALVRGSKTLEIEFRPVPVLTDTLFLRMYLKQQPYTLQIVSKNIAAGFPFKAWIADRYLNTKTEINLQDTVLYNFTPNPDTNSYRNRFMLIFKRQLETTPVPVTKLINQTDPNTTGNANSMSATIGKADIYPNPVALGGTAIIRFDNMAKGSYELTVYNAKGEKLSTRKWQYDGSSNVYSLPMSPSWAAGIYTVSIANTVSKKATNLQLIIGN